MPQIKRHRLPPPRGSTLLVTVVLLTVLTIVAVGLVERGGVSVASVNTKRHYDAAVSCAEGAREMLLGQFRLFGVSPLSLTLDTTVGDRRYASGHYDTFNVQSVRPAGAGAIQSDMPVGIANRTIDANLGGAPLVATVACTDSSGEGRQTEVDFLIRFGL